MTLLFSSAAWSWCEVYWGVNMSGVFGGKCADLAPYAPPGWLCRDHKNGGGIVTVLRDNKNGTYSMVEGTRVMPVASDRVQRFLSELKNRKVDKAQVEKEFEALLKSDDGKVSELTLREIRTQLTVR